MARLQWHPAFVQAMAIELTDYQEKEKRCHQEKHWSDIPLVQCVFEYKSPNDRATIEDYHKTQCYARLYAALNKADIDDMSVTVVATRYLRKLLSFLKRRYAVQQVQSGIYSVTGDTCLTQLESILKTVFYFSARFIIFLF